jgi:hypothetical protein
MVCSDDLAQIFEIDGAASAVEPTRSQNITVSCRRSAARAAAVGSGAGPTSVRNAAIASSNFRRWPTEVTPRPIKSSAVKLASTSASMWFSSNACT